MYDYIKSDVYRVYGKADFPTVLYAFFQEATRRFLWRPPAKAALPPLESQMRFEMSTNK